jgi:hypothetical protein
MKKILLPVICIVMMTTLVGCTDANEPITMKFPDCSSYQEQVQREHNLAIQYRNLVIKMETVLKDFERFSSSTCLLPKADHDKNVTRLKQILDDYGRVVDEFSSLESQ